MKHFYRIIRLFILAFLLLPVSAFADKQGKSGKITWHFDPSTGTLTISGKGEIKDYRDEKNVPWHKFRNSIKKVVVEDGVTTIGKWAFYRCEFLTSVTLPNTLIHISSFSFEGCDALESIHLPNSLNHIGWSAFQSCNELKEIHIPANVTYIGNFAFGWCSKLTDVTLPDKGIDIEDWAFYVYSNDSRLPVIDNIRYADNFLVGVVDTTLSSYTIREGTKWIGVDAFEGCHNMISITIPNSVTDIGHNAFKSCDQLTSITIPESVKYIGEDPFEGCDKLTSVIWNAKDVSYTSGNWFFDSKNRSTISSFIFGNEVEFIPYGLCEGMSRLKSVTLPESVTQIGYRSFSNCANLQTVHVNCSGVDIHKSVFDKSNIRSIFIPDNQTLPKEFPKNCKIVRIPQKQPLLAIAGDSLWLSESIPDGFIEPDEPCYIEFTIKNTGKGEGRQCVVSSSISQKLPFVQFTKQLQPFNIKPSATKNIRIPVTVSHEAIDTVVNLTITVKDIQEERIKSHTISVPIKKSNGYPKLRMQNTELLSSSNMAQKGQQISAKIRFANIGNGIARKVQCSFTLPSSCKTADDDQTVWNKDIMLAGADTTVVLDFLPQIKSPDSVSISYALTEKYGKYAESGTIPIVFGKTPTFKISANEEKSLAIAGLPQLIKISKGSVQTLQPDWFKKHNKPQNTKNPFPYAAIKLELKGNKDAVELAKQHLSLTEGGSHCVTEKDTKETNTIWLLVHCKHRSLSLDCGDGCEPVTLDIPADGLRPNEVWYGQVEVSIH